MTMRYRRFVRYVVAAAAAMLGLLACPGSPATASSRPASSTPASSTTPASSARAASAAPARAAAAARAELTRLTAGLKPVNGGFGHAARAGGQANVKSTNWSGYADTGRSFTAITATWRVPATRCGSATSLAAFWVGIDGYSSNSVEQDGTLTQCFRGRQYNYSWWEMYPSNGLQAVGQTIAAGDVIRASVVRSGTGYGLRVTDATHPADSFTTRRSCAACPDTSAEWIAEPLSGSSGMYPLAEFGTWDATGATVAKGAVRGVISSFPHPEITLVDSSGHVEAQPGSLNSHGTGFPVTWKRAQ